MNLEDYERAKERIGAERRRAIELMETAYDSQLRALDLVWMTRGDGYSLLTPVSAEPAKPPVSSPPPTPEPAPAAPQISFQDLLFRVTELLDSLPDPFDRNDVCAALELTPDRNALYRCLSILRQEGRIEVQQHGVGRLPVSYRKAPLPSAQ